MYITCLPPDPSLESLSQQAFIHISQPASIYLQHPPQGLCTACSLCLASLSLHLALCSVSPPWMSFRGLCGLHRGPTLLLIPVTVWLLRIIFHTLDPFCIYMSISLSSVFPAKIQAP